jgi:hypothetical protein
MPDRCWSFLGVAWAGLEVPVEEGWGSAAVAVEEGAAESVAAGEDSVEA